MTIVDRTRSGARSGIGRPGVDTHTHRAAAAPTVAAIWREGDPPGDRQFARIGDVALERGGRIPAVRVAYESWGRLNAAGDNAVLVEHALTGDSHVVGGAGAAHPSPGWWDGLIGAAGSRSSRCATRWLSKRASPTSSASGPGPPSWVARWAGCACWSGR